MISARADLRLRLLVTLFDQQPIIAALACGLASHAHQRPVAMQLLALQRESEQAFAVGRFWVWIERHPRAAIPQQHGPATILALGDDTLERAVVEWVVLDMDGKALLSRVEARSSWYRPTLEHAVHLQAKIVMQPPRSVLLHDKAQRCRFPLLLHDLASW